MKHSTVVRYKELTGRIYPQIGHIKLRELRADHLNDLYTLLGQDGQNKRGGKLSAKTILEHHRLISLVLEQAVKEGLVPFNVASRATLPKAEHKEVNYFQPEQVAAIRDALEQEPMKWKMLVHLLLITGARRGEVLGLKWDKVDFEGNRVYICNSVLYSRISASMKVHPKRNGPAGTSPYPLRQCSYSGGIGHGRQRNGCGWGSTTRIRTLYSPRATASPCTRTA